MLQTLPNELILSIARHVATPVTLAQTCHTCYSAVLPLIWRHLALDSRETYDRILSSRYRVALLTRFVHTITVGNPRRHHYTKQDIQRVLGMRIGDTPATVSPSFDPAVAHQLLAQFPKTSALVLTYDLLGPSSLATEVEATAFDGALTVMQYRSGPYLARLLAPFPRLTELIVYAQPAPSVSEDPGTWVLDANDLDQVDLPHLRRLALHLLDPWIPFLVLETLLDRHPALVSLTLTWQYPTAHDPIAQALLNIRPGRAVYHSTELILLFD